jgi:hypothetical protein
MNNAKQELVQIARKIAKERGYTALSNGLQPLEDYTERGERKSGLKSKFVHELSEELRECVAQQKERVWYYSEAADCLYYGACIDEVSPGEQAYKTALLTLASPSYQIEQASAEIAALAKYRLRASQPYRKDKETPEERTAREARENQAIEAALSSIEKWPGWPLPEVAKMYNVPVATLYYACNPENPLFPFRKSGKTVLINIKHPLWYKWYGSYKFSRVPRTEKPASDWPDPSEDTREQA